MPMRHEQQRKRAVLVEFLADLRADEFDSRCVDAGVVCPELGHDLLGQLRARQPLLHRQRGSARVALPKVCTANSPRFILSIASRMRVRSAACG